MKSAVRKITSESNNDAWILAEKVRADLDRQSCPGVYMNIAMESIVKHFSTSTLNTVVGELPEPVHHIMVDGKCIGYFSTEQMLRLRVNSIEQCAKLMESPNNNYAHVIRNKMGI